MSIETTSPPAPAEESNRLLYQPVPQITGKPDMVTKWVLVTPEMADEWVKKSALDQTFRQRKTKVRAVNRWKILMETDRFVNYLPNGPLCFDENNVLLNGKHRLTALAGQKRSFGFMVIEKVPRFMFSFFDTGLPRNLNDVFHIAGHVSKAQLGAAMRLGMRYEEMVAGVRLNSGWRDWSFQRDEHADVETFLSRRTDLADWYYVADQIYKGCRLIIAAGMAFRFYQSLAWPEGEEQLVNYCESLAKGSMLAPGSPQLLLREWGRSGQQQVQLTRGRRELHLLLLMRHFHYAVSGKPMERVTWANGFAMPLPYHPDGPEKARENILQALGEIDVAALKEQQQG